MATLQNMTFRHALFISFVFVSAVCFGEDTKKSSPEEFIRSLYQFHQPGKDTPDWFGDKQTLSTYFDKELTSLFLKNAECEKREQGVCNLDFDPVYEAQDFDEKTTNLEIAAVADQPNSFKVTFTNLGNANARLQTHEHFRWMANQRYQICRRTFAKRIAVPGDQITQRQPRIKRTVRVSQRHVLNKPRGRRKELKRLSRATSFT